MHSDSEIGPAHKAELSLIDDSRREVSESQYRKSIFDDSVFSSYVSSGSSDSSSENEGQNENLMGLIDSIKNKEKKK